MDSFLPFIDLKMFKAAVLARMVVTTKTFRALNQTYNYVVLSHLRMK